MQEVVNAPADATGVPSEVDQQAQKDQIEELVNRLVEERRRNRRLSARVQGLKREIQNLRSSRTWKLLTRLNSIKARLTGR